MDRSEVGRYLKGILYVCGVCVYMDVCIHTGHVNSATIHGAIKFCLVTELKD